MDEAEIRAELEAILVAFREGPQSLADLHLRANRVFEALRGIIEQQGRVEPEQERRLQDLIALFSEVETALDVAAH